MFGETVSLSPVSWEEGDVYLQNMYMYVGDNNSPLATYIGQYTVGTK
jgi:hypothetical protein